MNNKSIGCQIAMSLNLTACQVIIRKEARESIFLVQQLICMRILQINVCLFLVLLSIVYAILKNRSHKQSLFKLQNEK